jgi:hypothetical protein
VDVQQMVDRADHIPDERIEGVASGNETDRKAGPAWQAVRPREVCERVNGGHRESRAVGGAAKRHSDDRLHGFGRAVDGAGLNNHE